MCADYKHATYEYPIFRMHVSQKRKTYLGRRHPDTQPLQGPVHLGAAERARPRGVEGDERVSNKQSLRLDSPPHGGDGCPVLQQVELVGNEEHSRHRGPLHGHLYMQGWAAAIELQHTERKR